MKLFLRCVSECELIKFSHNSSSVGTFVISQYMDLTSQGHDLTPHTPSVHPGGALNIRAPLHRLWRS